MFQSETVSETDLVEADQPRPSAGVEEERGETAEGPHSMVCTTVLPSGH